MTTISNITISNSTSPIVNPLCSLLKSW
jgi:hypothetical protein